MSKNPADYGFSPGASGATNAAALQAAVAGGGTVEVREPGVYHIAATVLLDSHTELIFGLGVVLRKVVEGEPFTHVLLNRGALEKRFDEHITVRGLHLEVNGVDVTFDRIYGLRGQVAFFYVRDLRITGFRCDDLGKDQFAIHVCTFEDLVIEDAHIRGMKDGVHLGRGLRFRISQCVFQTYDDAIALNAHDYATSNPELGWIENGVVESCHDLAHEHGPKGFFCRILAGGWLDWRAGMQLQHSDTVIANGKIYRVQAEPDGTVYTSKTCPEHASGMEELDGIRWGLVQNDPTATAGVRNVVFRDIFLEKPRLGFSVHFDNDRNSRSYYPGAEIPVQENLLFENVRVLHERNRPLLLVKTPLNSATFSNCYLRNGGIAFHSNGALKDHGMTSISLNGCVFGGEDKLTLLENAIPEKRISLKSTGSQLLNDSLQVELQSGDGDVVAELDLPAVEV